MRAYPFLRTTTNLPLSSPSLPPLPSLPTIHPTSPDDREGHRRATSGKGSTGERAGTRHFTGRPAVHTGEADGQAETATTAPSPHRTHQTPPISVTHSTSTTAHSTSLDDREGHRRATSGEGSTGEHAGTPRHFAGRPEVHTGEADAHRPLRPPHRIHQHPTPIPITRSTSTTPPTSRDDREGHRRATSSEGSTGKHVATPEYPSHHWRCRFIPQCCPSALYLPSSAAALDRTGQLEQPEHGRVTIHPSTHCVERHLEHGYITTHLSTMSNDAADMAAYPSIASMATSPPTLPLLRTTPRQRRHPAPIIPPPGPITPRHVE